MHSKCIIPRQKIEKFSGEGTSLGRGYPAKLHPLGAYGASILGSPSSKSLAPPLGQLVATAIVGRQQINMCTERGRRNNPISAYTTSVIPAYRCAPTHPIFCPSTPCIKCTSANDTNQNSGTKPQDYSSRTRTSVSTVKDQDSDWQHCWAER